MSHYCDTHTSVSAAASFRDGGKLESRSSQEKINQSSQASGANKASPGGNGASPPARGASQHLHEAFLAASGAAEGKPATMTITLSSDSAQRLKAQAAESGLHQSDSGLARERPRFLLHLHCWQTPNLVLYGLCVILMPCLNMLPICPCSIVCWPF